MTEIVKLGKNRLSTPIGRWAGVGPYYAMFPVNFAFDVVQKYCPPGGAILDPFVGRGSSIYAAVTTKRYGYGIEINKVGWLYSFVKLMPASQEDVMARHIEISGLAGSIESSEIDELTEFFTWCYSVPVLKYLLAARNSLEWQTDRVDATLMAIILIYLHGAKNRSLSNQMRQSKAMAPDYSIKWWKEHDEHPPELSPKEFLKSRIEWRYKKGIPETHAGNVHLGDSITHLDKLIEKVRERTVPEFDLLFTSPPYYNVTSYYYDQWLRLWMLGEGHIPTKSGGEWQNGFWSKEQYKRLLQEVLCKSAKVLKRDAVVWIRTDKRKFTLNTTIETLEEVFPDKTVISSHSKATNSQTSLFGDKSSKPGEVDLVLLPPD